MQNPVRAALVAAMFFALFCAAPSTMAATDVHEIAAKVDGHYNTLVTLRADFTETYKGAGLSRSEAGTLILRRPGRMRWEYTQPREKLFVVDGKTAWFYVPGERQARRVEVKKLDDLRTPLAYLLGRTKLEKQFDGLSIASDQQAVTPGNVVLRGVPKHMQDRIAYVLLEATRDGVLTRILAEELDGSTTEFRLSNQHENVPTTEAMFKFIPPKGTEVVQTKETQF